MVPVLIGVLVVAVAAVAVVAVMRFTGPGEPTAVTAMPNRYQVYESGQANELLANRDDDPRPFTERDFFAEGDSDIGSGDLAFTLQAQSITEDCTEAVWGSRALAAVESADCSQVVRGGYVSADHIGVAAVFKLRDVEASRTLAKGLDPSEDEEAAEGSEGGGFLLPPSSEAPFDALGTGYSSAEATVNGHYLLVLWVQSKDSASAEEVEVLQDPLVTLSRFDMPIYQRINERKNFLESNGQDTGTGTGAEEDATGTDTGDTGAEGTGTGTEGTGTEGAGEGAGAPQGTG
ncbi:hypothetical protein [Thermobifida halotolerans]|uniref:hypothetical protein n=1 Tax=Thermobifida halotolerans TaxID=483545 RepID=UPI001FB30359|nr:hypothetical protein [Thermobifida halotolerans]